MMIFIGIHEGHSATWSFYFIFLALMDRAAAQRLKQFVWRNG